MAARPSSSSRPRSASSVQSVSVEGSPEGKKKASVVSVGKRASNGSKTAWQENQNQKPKKASVVSSKDEQSKSSKSTSSQRQVEVPSETSSEAISEIWDGEDEEEAPLPVPEPNLTLEHLKVCQVGSSMTASHFTGCTRRSELTGIVSMKEDRYMPSYVLVDLFTRSRIFGTPEDLMQDEYIFVFEAMAMRTWMFHALMMDETAMAEERLDANLGVLQKCLDERIVDAKVPYGERSPLQYWMAVLLLMSMTGDQELCVAALFVTACLVFVTSSYNTPKTFRDHRLWAIPLRICSIGFMVFRLITRPESQELTVLIPILLSIFVILADFWNGDVQAIQAYRFMCSYKIIKEIPPRVFAVKRSGAAHLEEDLVGKRPRITANITGFTWARGNVLIADLNGILVELRRPRLDEWKVLLQAYQADFTKEIGFLSLGCYTPERPNYESMQPDIQESERKAIIRKHQKENPVTWSMVNYWEKAPYGSPAAYGN
eukprot:CAMPEP_0197640802 /NCGR_PEP_ID=MMETSP1338-20131121/14960_1 /TAXON_ID=43686 ORGANISM="Pelagodinium beii, Strain RCC1491" /NCGR_SAMPLE_ID=MMETSP1338 /ASSEMBLY_ACC=CAM_ASM_000754 /LENGTH=486 /DNA_ID=CAMNT_0043213679 /DNA_START=25 /DNA_END=1482 /DNA_ORIENTATION=-